MKTQELLERLPMPEELREQLLPAIAKSGPMKGSLLSDAPGTNPAWQVLIGQVAPVRVKIWSVISSGSAARDQYLALEKQVADLPFNLPKLLSATEPYMRWNCERIDAAAVLAEVEPYLNSPVVKAPVKRKHGCVQALDDLAALLAEGSVPADRVPGLELIKDDRGNQRLRYAVNFKGTTLRVVMDNNARAIVDRADKLEKQIASHKSKSESKGLKEARSAYNWKPNLRVVPLSPERAAECGMETL